MTEFGDRQVGVAGAASHAPGPVAVSILLGHIAAGSATTRADLARVTGLARSTVSQRVAALLDANLIVEGGTAPSSGGRPALLLRLNAEAGLILSADLGATRACLAVSDLGGQRLARRCEDICIDQQPERLLDRVDHRFGELLAGIGRDARQVKAIAVGVPAPVEFATGTVVRPPLMPRWDGYAVPGYFADRYPAQTVVDNDVNLMALGEHRQRCPEVEHLLFVKVGTGIGCGIVINGELHRGAEGAAGDIGHIRVPGNDDAICRCGNSGCLEAVAGGEALARRLRDRGLTATTAREVARLAAESNRLARQEVRIAARHIGEVLAAVVSFANPAVIVVGGSLAQLDETLLAGIRSVIHDRALPLATRSLRIETSTLEEAGTIGAVALAQQRVLSPAGLAACGIRIDDKRLSC